MQIYRCMLPCILQKVGTFGNYVKNTPWTPIPNLGVRQWLFYKGNVRNEKAQKKPTKQKKYPFYTSNSSPSLSRKSTPMPDSFSATFPNDSRSNAKPTAKVILANLIPVKISTWIGTPPTSIEAVNLKTPFFSSFRRSCAGFMVKSQRPIPLRMESVCHSILSFARVAKNVFLVTIKIQA